MNKNKYDLIEEYGVISIRGEGETVKLCHMTWNNGEPVYDLRIWDGSNPSRKGITLTRQGLEALAAMINNLNKERDNNVKDK